MNEHQEILERENRENLEEVKNFQRMVNKNYKGSIRDNVNRVVWLLEESYGTIEDMHEYLDNKRKVATEGNRATDWTPAPEDE